MVKQQKFKVPTLDALAVALMVYEQNGCKVIRDVENNNKSLILKHFSETPDAVINIDRAREILDGLNQRVILNTLTNTKSNEFLTNMNSLLLQEYVTSRDFGIIAWAPKLFEDCKKADDQREQLLSISVSSEFIGEVSKKVELVYNQINCRYLANYDSYIHNGTDEQGNLVCFFNNKQIPDKSKIKARVKTHRIDTKLGNGKVTIVNYVKVVK